MQSKLLFLMAVAVLFCVLAVGNPFLPPRGRAPAEPASAPPPPTHALAAPARRSDPAVRLVSDTPTAPPADAELCPDAALRPLVVGFRRDAQRQPIWLLRDGRAVRLDAAGLRLVAIDGDAADGRDNAAASGR